MMIMANLLKQKTIFYTGLYHLFIQPSNIADVSGNYLSTDNSLQKANDKKHYSTFSLWDTYRAAHPLFTLVEQKRTNDFINTFLTQYEQGGLLPVWELSSNETDCMIGYHAVPVIVDAYVKGIRGFDAIQFNGLECLAHALQSALHLRQLLSLVNNRFIELFILPFQVGQIRLQRFNSLIQIIFHGPRLA